MRRAIRARELDPTARLGARGRGDVDAPPTVSGRAPPPTRRHESDLASWAEADALRHCVASYSELRPPPRSTIAAAFSPDGETLASTHGDHTVKLISVRTGECVRTLTGHRRTPWVVRFHPTDANVLASGSLDHEVRIWNSTTGACTLCFDFGKPIASLAFHAVGDVLAVASGHKLYTWCYANAFAGRGRDDDADPGAGATVENGNAGDARPNANANATDAWTGSFPTRSRGAENASGDAGASGDLARVPCISLRTRRSLRAVHFHPHGAPLLLSAEVNETSEHDVPPLRAMTTPHRAGERETAYAAALSAAVAATAEQRAAATPDGGGVEEPRTTYVAPRACTLGVGVETCDAMDSDAVEGESRGGDADMTDMTDGGGDRIGGAGLETEEGQRRAVPLQLGPAPAGAHVPVDERLQPVLLDVACQVVAHVVLCLEHRVLAREATVVRQLVVRAVQR